MTGQACVRVPIRSPRRAILLRAIDAAGGWGQIAIPERVELTRMVDKNREATIMLMGDRSANTPSRTSSSGPTTGSTSERTSAPLAVIRNGFRASYGFGFVMDRNIADDIFGPPPVNAIGQ